MNQNSINKVLNSLIKNGFAFALWRNPDQKEPLLLISKNKEPNYNKIDLKALPQGFALSPFSGGQSLFLEADFLYPIHNINYTELENLGLNLEEDIEPINLNLNKEVSDQSHYTSLIKKTIEELSVNAIDKIVISRKKEVGTLSGNDHYNLFSKLEESYPHAFISMVNLPWLGQTWIGATPEILVEQNKEGIFKTMALAGTQKAVDASGQPLLTKEALWSQKEIEEQALVSRYIINCFKKIRVREFKENGPRTYKAGNLLHLNTNFEVNTKAINYPEIATEMLELLHPTSAVCGMPKEKAMAFIKNNEGYNREFYSGFLGPVNIQGESNLFVNLRTMKIENNQVCLYAGGGITTDSIPEKEWQETELKMETILQAINS